MGMPRQDIGDTENQQRMQYQASTDALLAQLALHHDYSMKRPVQETEAPKVMEPEPINPIEGWIERQKQIHRPIKSSMFQVVDAIQRAVLGFYPGVTLADLKAPYRAQKIVRPRQLAMYLINDLTPHTMPDIGRRFGGRDHTTVLHAIRKMGALCQTDPEIAAQAECVKASLDGQR